jgi:hypothetical protein
MNGFWTRCCSGRLMPEHPAVSATRLQNPILSTTQHAFLVSLASGPRPTNDCQDAITVGSLMRLHLVAWDEVRHRPSERRRGTGTFSLTPAGEQLLTSHDGQEGDG